MTVGQHMQLGKDLVAERLVVGPLANNVYLLSLDGHHLLVDAADEAETLVAWLDGRRPETIVTTHRHHDHVGALADIARSTGARTVSGTPDAEAIEAATGVACEGLWTGDTIALGELTIEVVGLVGHTPGSIALVVRQPGAPVHLFTGDSLFPGGVGKTHSPADFQQLLDDVTRQLFDRYDDAFVWPGHGEPTMLEDERPHLDEWRERGW